MVDATAVPHDRSGVGRYVDGLLGNIGGPVVIVCQSADSDHYARLAPTAKLVAQSRRIRHPAIRFLWEQACLPTIARRERADVIFSPHYTIPLATRLPRVVTFHDGTFFSNPEVHTRIKGVFFRTWTRISAKLAARIVVPSGATARALGELLRIDPSHLVIAHHGVDAAVFHPPTPAELTTVAGAWGLTPHSWITFLGTLEPRKNVSSLVRAFHRVAANTVASGKNVPTLLLVGARGWDKSLDEAIAEVPVEYPIVRLGFIPLEHLRVALGGAALVVYPSLGEGFGLPVVEAMACGAAVVTTRRLAIPEVGGDAVAYSEPTPEALEIAMTRLLADHSGRAELGARALERSGQFTWSECARLHWSAFSEAWLR